MPTGRTRTAIAIAVWAAWLAGIGPLLAVILPLGRASTFGFYVGAIVLVAYFFAPPFVLTKLLD